MDKIRKTKTVKTETTETEAKVVAPANVQKASSSALKVVIRPLVTEKAASAQSVNQIYTFVVDPSANKIQVAAAVKELYNVTPVAVRVVNVQGHRVRFGKNQGKRSDYKKAMVTLKKGDSITIHEGV